MYLLIRMAIYLSLFPLMMAAVALVLASISRPARDWFVSLGLALTFVMALPVARAGLIDPFVVKTHLLVLPGTLIVPLGIRIDGLSGLVLVMVTGASLAAGVFSCQHIRHGRYGDVLFALLLVAIGAMNGAILSVDLMTFHSFALLLTLSVMLMVGLHLSASGRETSIKVLLAIEVPGLVLPTTAWLILARGGTIDLHRLLESNASVLGDLALPTTLALIVGLAMRAALAPGHTWLTDAVQVSTTPAATLMVGLSLPLGIYGLLRILSPAVEPSGLTLLASLGGLAVLTGAIGAVRTPTLARFLAFQAIAQAGFAAIALGLGTPLGWTIAGTQLLVMAVATPLLFLGMGTVLQPAHTHRLFDFAHQRLSSPLAGAATLVGVAIAAGLPPLVGFGARVQLLQQLLQAGSWGFLLLMICLVGTAVLALALLRPVGLGKSCEAIAATPRREGHVLSLALILLAATCVVVSLVPPGLADRFLWPAVFGSASPPPAPAAELIPMLLLYLALGTALLWRAAESSLLPESMQGRFDSFNELATRLRPTLSVLGDAASARRLDAYSIIGAGLFLLSEISARVLGVTLARLGRRF